METVKIRTSQNVDIDYEVATLGDRVLGRLIDGLVFIGMFMLLGLIVVMFDQSLGDNTFTIVVAIVAFSILFFYDLVSEIFFDGQSVGKKAMKIKVVSLDGGSPTVGQYLLRWVFRLVDFTLTSHLAGLITVAASEKKQRVGDMVARTTLIKTVPRTNIKHVAFKPPRPDYVPTFAEAATLSDKEVALIFEVLKNFRESENYALLHQTAAKISDHLNITDRRGMDDRIFLRTIVKDFNFYQAEVVD